MRRSVLGAGLILIFTSGLVSGVTWVGGEVTGSVQWNASGSPYVVTQSVVVRSGSLLAVGPGVEVLFEPGCALAATGGVLSARGTAASNIVFRAHRSISGVADSNRWGGIAFLNGAVDSAFDVSGVCTGGCVIEHAVIRDAGGDIQDGGLMIDSAGISVRSCVITHNSRGGLVIRSGAGTRVESCSIVSNTTAGVGGGVRVESAGCSGEGFRMVEHASVGAGDGTNKVFTGTAPAPLHAPFFTITDGVETFLDTDADGTLVGSQGGVGAVDYLTGQYAVTFKQPPAVTANVTADYVHQTMPGQLSQFREVVDEVIGIGNGVVPNFSGAVVNCRVLSGSLTITDGNEMFVDPDKDGVLTGSEGGSGSINHATGGFSVTFTIPPDAGVQLLATYLYQVSDPASIAPQLTGNLISGNRASMGGGMWATDVANAVWRGNSILGNAAATGGGVWVSHVTNLVFLDNLVASNQAGFGGGIQLWSSDAHILTNRFIDNQASNAGGALRVESAPDMVLFGNLVQGNSSDAAGGGIFLRSGSIGETTEDVAVSGEVVGIGNGVDTQFSGVLAAFPIRAGSVTITDGSEAFGDHLANGTLIGSAGGSGTVDYSTGDFSVRFWLQPSAGRSITASYVNRVIIDVFPACEGNTISSNRAERGGGIYAETFNDLWLGGNTVCSNWAVQGSGLWFTGGVGHVVLSSTLNWFTRIFDNAGPYVLYNASAFRGSTSPDGAGNVDASHVWWGGSTNAEDIADIIFDHADDPTKGVVLCESAIHTIPDPRISISWPTNGAVFYSPSVVTVLVSAASEEGISMVRVYEGTSDLGGLTNGPYALVWNSAAVGDYVLTAQAWNIAGQVATSMPVEVAVMAPVWMGSVSLGDGWRWNAWLGFFAEVGNGWIYHNEHHWIYCVGTTSDSIWFWTQDMGWLWTSAKNYPYFYRNSDGAWLFYDKGSVGPRWFYNFSTSAWEAH